MAFWNIQGWIYRFELAPAGVWPGGSLDLARPPAVRKAPVGARVASPQSPILRWSKGSVSRFRSLGGL
jgi:hypothetical protein